ncbi:alpha/beta fold hydrolase [Streptomyces sp. 3214.6]|uniref:alpha/beta fold hydrolase n=1 Tax=Streptomyces sp. 3214.6 TaxID=1882757 RepID=UPI00090C0F79|nr:alpha/beta hydrolase [Streptomyces sp. 3214.6]SHH30047.1 Pimeloyl-ACP methyl ester carboxylesterase [Streptomyces sp. 3214.6]
MTASLHTAENQHVEVDGVQLAYREIGTDTGVPLVMVSRFRASIDDWDPAVVDRLATDRRVIVFDNTGIGFSEGDVQPTVRKMAEVAISFVEALGLTEVDLLGFSLGGFVTQRFTLTRPDLVRSVVLVGTGGGGGEGAVAPDREKLMSLMARPEPSVEALQALFFSSDAAGHEAAQTYWDNIYSSRRRPESDVSLDAAKVQLGALGAFAAGDDSTLPEADRIQQPVLIVNGDNDIMVPTPNSFLLSQKIPNAQLIVYPNSGHGSLFQYPEAFTRDVLGFLRAQENDGLR